MKKNNVNQKSELRGDNTPHEMGANGSARGRNTSSVDDGGVTLQAAILSRAGKHVPQAKPELATSAQDKADLNRTTEATGQRPAKIGKHDWRNQARYDKKERVQKVDPQSRSARIHGENEGEK